MMSFNTIFYFYLKMYENKGVGGGAINKNSISPLSYHQLILLKNNYQFFPPFVD